MMYKIGIDANGGDHGAVEVIKAVKKFSKNSENTIVVYGTKESITKEIGDFKADNIEFIYTTEIISSKEEPTVALRQKKDSSLVRGANDVKTKELDAFISAGSTGALIAAGVFICKRLNGVARPALAGLFPSKTKVSPTMVLDLGANVETKPEHLVDYAKIANIYMAKMYELSTPEIGLLNVGTEEVKGNELYKETYQLLKNSQMTFIGNVEARELMTTSADILVVDGFSGNMILKTVEGIVSEFMKSLKKIYLKNIINKLSALVIKKDLKLMKSEMDYEEIGASPVFGIKGLLLKAHGSSTEKSFYSALVQAEKAIEAKFTQELIEYFEKQEN